MKKKTLTKCEKLKIKKHEFQTQTKDELNKEALSILMNLRLNLYQKIYKLTTTPTESWQELSFLSNDKKISTFISQIDKEIERVVDEKFNFKKYEMAIYTILGLNENKFPKEIIKNMYIAKLQNITFLLKKQFADGDEIKEVKNTAKNISR